MAKTKIRTLPKSGKTPIRRRLFFAKIKISKKTGCWLWQGSVCKRSKYGQFWNGEKVIGAHVFSYILHKGPIPAGLEPDHKCRRRHCVNPEHLEAVTRRVNLLRGKTIPARKSAQITCIRGHAFTEENIYRAKNGTRGCRICRREKDIAWKNANRLRRRELDRQCYARKVGKL